MVRNPIHQDIPGPFEKDKIKTRYTQQIRQNVGFIFIKKLDIYIFCPIYDINENKKGNVMKELKENLKSLLAPISSTIAAFCCITMLIIIECGNDVSQGTPKTKAEKTTEIPVADSTKIVTYRDTVLVLDYKPRAKHVPSTTIVSNKSGKTYKWNERKNLPVERGDEIVIDVRKVLSPDDKTWTEYEIVKNLTTEKLKQEYMNKR